jgi:hypothetical protein
MTNSKRVRTVLVLAVLATAGVAAYWSIDAVRRDRAIEAFEAALASLQPGDKVDVGQAFPLGWDRVIIIGPYERGATANDALGFHHYGEDDDLILSDAGQFIIFVKDRSVVADLRNWGPSWFAEHIRSFRHDDAVFELHADRWLYRATPPT